MAKEKVRFTVTSADLNTAYSFDCQKWIRHLASNSLKTDDLSRMIGGKFPGERLFVLDMLEFLRKSDSNLDKFLSKRGGIFKDDLLSVEYADVRALVSSEFPDIYSKLTDGEQSKKVIKRRQTLKILKM